MKRPQIHLFRHSFGYISTDTREIKSFPHSMPKIESLVIPIDQFWSEEHNKRNGFISTSPELFDDPKAVPHFAPAPPDSPLPKDMTNDEIFDIIVPKELQTPCELAKLKRVRPQKPVDEPVPEPAFEPAPEPAPGS